MPDSEAGRLSFKLVYYGPAQSGKTTNLLRLHDQLAPEMIGEIMTLETQDDRTLFFDLLPLGFRAPSGLLIKFRLFTVPGQVAHDGTRKAVLSRADGVVFVADSARTQETNNAESFQTLAANCSRVGLDFEHLPLVVQFNKQDLPDAVPEQEIRDNLGKISESAKAAATDRLKLRYLLKRIAREEKITVADAEVTSLMASHAIRSGSRTAKEWMQKANLKEKEVRSKWLRRYAAMVENASRGAILRSDF